MFKNNCYQSAVVAASLGLALVSTSSQPPVSAQETLNSPQQERLNQERPLSPSEPNRPSPQTETEQNANERRDDNRVYISDIYPEYCRSYFLRRDYVSLNEYYAGMSRCKYGNDRWQF